MLIDCLKGGQTISLAFLHTLCQCPTTLVQWILRCKYLGEFPIELFPVLVFLLTEYRSRQHSLSASSMDQPNVQMMQNIYPAQTPSKVGSSDSGDQVRVVHSRPKPQCWEHGCNGRQFSTFSNLLRHQRVKSGAATKSICPNCGAEFTRTTARNGHMAHEKCKQRRTAATATTTTTTSS